MHGLIFRTVETFISDSFGHDTWSKALVMGDVPVTSFEAMLTYDAALLDRVLSGCATILNRPREHVLEDIGTYLVTHQTHAAIRRLMRFGGQDFVELLHSLDELPGRTRLAVPGLLLPGIAVTEHRPHHFSIRCDGGPLGFGHVLVGLLRAMADDYGTLAMVDHIGAKDGSEILQVTVIDAEFADDRGFSLAPQNAATAS
ncbi:heme NO-binding domain-containing protein [Marivita hallyeonensis]|uniref:Haem-NO-binding n=1 Tax=Marivita hallyeonensis TaxID=996342 RepID=A0A1M5X1G0_9RHOB|nr:heme NO-binding domain-containing protein [Marivita hallyeonensis]SHH93631.1 Haem-NO-binding [Marivita hallyeonensis]